jgi:prevent-host-death family protein
MPSIGVRELKIHVSEVVRHVRDTRARYVVTHRGQPVAVIVPYSPRETGEVLTREEGWARFFEASERLGREWNTPLTAVEVLDEMRR